MRPSYLKRLLARTRLPAKKAEGFVSWDSISSLALVIGSEEQANRHRIDQWIAACGKFVEVFYAEPSSRKPTFSDWRCFTRKEANLLKLPRSRVLAQLSKLSFDVVINTTGERNEYAAWISAAVRAKYKCAVVEGADKANLLITRRGEKLEEHLAAVQRYMRMIRPRNQ